MKKSFICLGLLLIIFNLFSQDYVPMAVENTTWIPYAAGEDSHYKVLLRLEGDTTVNDLKYSKIYHYEYPDAIVLDNTKKLLGLVRDDIEEKKVYGGFINGAHEGSYQGFLNLDAECDWGDSFEEKLLYDFDVAVGDTLDICMFPAKALITDITMEDQYGYDRRTLTLMDENGDYDFIAEGVGTCIGLFKGKECIWTGSPIQYHLLDYCIGTIEDCGLLTSSQSFIKNEKVKIYPNPAQSYIKIASINSLNKISIYNGLGKLVKTYNGQLEIDLQDFVPGVYFVIVEEKDGHSWLNRLVKI